MLENFAAHALHIAEAIIDTDTTKCATIINNNRLASPRLCRAKRYIGQVLTHLQTSRAFMRATLSRSIPDPLSLICVQS